MAAMEGFNERFAVALAAEVREKSGAANPAAGAGFGAAGLGAVQSAAWAMWAQRAAELIHGAFSGLSDSAIPERWKRPLVERMTLESLARKALAVRAYGGGKVDPAEAYLAKVQSFPMGAIDPAKQPWTGGMPGSSQEMHAYALTFVGRADVERVAKAVERFHAKFELLPIQFFSKPVADLEAAAEAFAQAEQIAQGCSAGAAGVSEAKGGRL